MRRVGDTYVHVFRHPLLKKVVSRGLGTDDEALAVCIIDDLKLLCKRKDLLATPDPGVLKSYKYRAVECIFGRDRTKELLGSPPTIAARFSETLNNTIEEATTGALLEPDTDPNFDLDDEESLERSRAKALSRVGADFERRLIKEKVVEELQKRLDDANQDNVNLRRALDLQTEKVKHLEADGNVHVLATVEAAIKASLYHESAFTSLRTHETCVVRRQYISRPTDPGPSCCSASTTRSAITSPAHMRAPQRRAGAGYREAEVLLRYGQAAVKHPVVPTNP
ncbi:MAG: hypothetical protein M5U26_15475 [Planctomycetota bacterium]|nr:hypothetical protein [Planctomycetota bacterium]